MKATYAYIPNEAFALCEGKSASICGFLKIFLSSFGYGRLVDMAIVIRRKISLLATAFLC